MPSTRARPVSVGAEVALAFGVGVAAFAIVGVPLAAADSDTLAIVLAPFFAAAVLALTHLCGIAYGVPAAMAALLAYDWFEFPPTHAAEFPDSANLADLVVYLGVAALVGELAAYAGRRAVGSERARSELAEEQAALRRVATRAAQGVAPDELFVSVAEEGARLFGTDIAGMVRYGSNDSVVPIGTWIAVGTHPDISERWALDEGGVAAEIARTGRSARIDDWTGVPGAIATYVRDELHAHSSVGSPIVVEGQLWGALVLHAAQGPRLPADAESRLEKFTELVATAIANSEARVELSRLADEQAALRRVATLVARESPPTEVFAAVAEELGRLLRLEGTRIWRYEDDDSATVVATWGKLGALARLGTRVPADEHAVGRILSSGRAARVDYSEASGPSRAEARRAGIRSAAGTPIVVDGQLWGAMIVATTGAEPLPADTEARVAGFAELVATAISNLQARSELAESRLRILAATDEERRRVVRDLHDGAQQRLVQTVITLKLARGELEAPGGRAAELVTEALGHAEKGMTELRELAHGILPAALTRGGLRAGVDSLAARMPLPVANGVTAGRLPRVIEATAYFVVAEALTNVAKHARAHEAEVAASVDDGVLHIEVRDDGIGGARADGHGLLGLGDRLAALDGTLRIESAPGRGTLVAAAIPVPATPGGT